LPPKKNFIGDPQEYFNERLRPDRPYHAVFERFASERMFCSGNQRIEAEKLARSMKTDYGLILIALEVRKLNDP
jgi:hypothetical protein